MRPFAAALAAALAAAFSLAPAHAAPDSFSVTIVPAGTLTAAPSSPVGRGGFLPPPPGVEQAPPRRPGPPPASPAFREASPPVPVSASRNAETASSLRAAGGWCLIEPDTGAAR